VSEPSLGVPRESRGKDTPGGEETSGKGKDWIEVVLLCGEDVSGLGDARGDALKKPDDMVSSE
jgi:hypothetical protein